MRPPREARSLPSGYRYVMTTDQVDARQILATSLMTAVDHVGIAFADLDAAIAWYHDTLGMVLVHEEINEDQGIREAMIAVQDGEPGTAQIQLMAPIDESSAIAKFLDKRGPGIQQMAVRVSDLDALCEQLREKGIRLVYEAPRRGTANSRINFTPQGRRRRADGAGRAGPLAAHRSRPLSGRATVCPIRPARRMPVPTAGFPSLRSTPGRVCRPHHKMRSAGTDFVVTSGTAISFDGMPPRTGRTSYSCRSGPISTRCSTGDSAGGCCWRGGVRRRAMRRV